MFWSIDNDDFRGNCHSKPYPLIEAGKEALFGYVVLKYCTKMNVVCDWKFKKLRVQTNCMYFRDSKIEPSQEKETKTTLKSRQKLRPNSRTTTSAPQEKAPATTTTPEPPTTPDTGTG